MIFFFYLFALLAVSGAVGVVAYKNPVTSAFSLIISFLGLAALFIQLDAYLVGILQILVYAGAIMVLFIFIIMLLDIDKEEHKHFTGTNIFGGVLVGVGFLGLLFVVLMKSGVGFEQGLPELTGLGGPGNSDVHHIGKLLFSKYWFPIQMVGVLLLVSTVGVVVLSRKYLK
ncbi:MAG: NADH-quinone oxidoreductase subunit J [Verrucomicrobiales bacterium]|nr:NADH-quinone oxidoreductase subunit J [Verrucomicrobiales bacterium]